MPYHVLTPITVVLVALGYLVLTWPRKTPVPRVPSNEERIAAYRMSGPARQADYHERYLRGAQLQLRLIEQTDQKRRELEERIRNGDLDRFPPSHGNREGFPVLPTIVGMRVAQ